MTYEAWRISYQSSEQAARAAYAECVRLRARIAEKEKQEPVAVAKWTTGVVAVHLVGDVRPGDILYLASGAQPAPSVPDVSTLIRRAAMALEVVGTEWRESDPTLRLDLAAALSAAQESQS